jgi:hypothetical protein
MSSLGIQNLCKTSAYDDKLKKKLTNQWQFFWGVISENYLSLRFLSTYTYSTSGGIMSVFGTQNLNKVSDYGNKLITEPKNQWQFILG